MSKSSRAAAKLFAVLSLLILLSSPAKGEGPPPFPATAMEWSYLMGYGITHRGFGATRTEVQTVDFVGRFGYFLSDELGSGWYRGQFEHVLELPFHLVVDPKTGFFIGGNVLLKWNFNALSQDRFIPYLFAGGGFLYDQVDLPTMGSRLDFSYGGGTGIQYFIRKDLALSGEYRYHHISNANTAEPNEPLNSSKFLIGISLFK